MKCLQGRAKNLHPFAPGLYAFGEPGIDDDVLASANYKLSFNALRQELKGLNIWQSGDWNNIGDRRNVMSSQRVLWKGYFNEVLGTVLE